MHSVEAVYENGAFRPLQDVGLAENQRVLLSVLPLPAVDPRAWLTCVQQRQQQIVAERGCFPDSTTDIAEDRQR